MSKRSPHYTTEQFSLRPLTIDDADTFWQHAKDPSVRSKWLTRNKDTYELSDAQQFIKLASRERKEDTKKVLGIDKEGEIIGAVSLTRNHWPYNHTAYISCRVSPDYRKQGIATQAMQLISDHGTDLFSDLIRIEARIFDLNQPLQKILPQIGFTLEGRLKKRVIFNDALQDELIFAKYII